MYQYLSFPFPSPSFTPFLSSLSPSQEHRLKRNTGYDQYIKFFITQTLQCGVLPGPRWTPSLMPWSTICLDHGVPSAVSHSFCFSCLCGFFVFYFIFTFFNFSEICFSCLAKGLSAGSIGADSDAWQSHFLLKRWQAC